MIYAFEQFELDTRRFELRRRGELRSTEPQVFNVLVYLVSHRDRVVSKEELFEALWPGRIVTESTLTSRIKAARKALDDSGDAQRVIATFNRRGYRFVAPIRERSEPLTHPAVSPRSSGEEALGDVSPTLLSQSTLAMASAPLVEPPSLAVIPFAHNPASESSSWSADSLTEDISIQIARIPGFRVISRNSTFSYKNREISARQIGEELNVRYLVEGSLWEAGGRVRIAAQLLEAATGQIIWGDRKEVAADALHAMRDDIVREIASHIEPEILRSELPALKQRCPVDLDAWSLYRRAHAVLSMRGWSEESLAESVQLLHGAIERSPDLAFAHAYLALVLAVGHLLGMLSDDDSKVDARCAAETAVALDAQNSDVLGYAGCAFADLGDSLRGIGLLRSAVELDPSNAQARAALGAALLSVGEADGVEFMRYGMHISPRDHRLGAWGAVLARGLLDLGRIDEAISEAHTACSRDDKIALPRIVLAIACAQNGDLQQAAAAMADARRIRPQLSLNEITCMARDDDISALRSAGIL